MVRGALSRQLDARHLAVASVLLATAGLASGPLRTQGLLWNGEHDLSVRDFGQQSLLEPQAPQGQAFGIATRAEVSALAGECQEKFVLAGTAVDPGETVLQNPAGEEFVDHVGDDRSPVAPPLREPLVLMQREACIVDRAELSEVILEKTMKRRSLRLAGLVDSARRGGADAFL